MSDTHTIYPVLPEGESAAAEAAQHLADEGAALRGADAAEGVTPAPEGEDRPEAGESGLEYLGLHQMPFTAGSFTSSSTASISGPVGVIFTLIISMPSDSQMPK